MQQGWCKAVAPVLFVAAQRTSELGLRMALGAWPREVVFLFQTRRADTAAIVAALAVLTCTAMLACYLSARRTSRIDPLTALRAE